MIHSSCKPRGSRCRDQLRSPAVGEQLARLKFSPDDRKVLLEFVAAAPAGTASAMLICEEALDGKIDDALLVKSIPGIAQYIEPQRIDALVELLDHRFGQQGQQEIVLLDAIADVAGPSRLADQRAAAGARWWGLYARCSSAPRNPIGRTSRCRERRLRPAPGVLNSAVPKTATIGLRCCHRLKIIVAPAKSWGAFCGLRPFAIPPKLSFWLCGHNGAPGQPDKQANYVRLVLADGTEIARSYPPRSDIARKFTWDLAAQAGKQGRLEIVDGMTADTGYAWLAVGRFDPEVVPVPTTAVGDAMAPRLESIRRAARLKLEPLADDIVRLANEGGGEPVVRMAAADALVRLRPAAAVEPLTKLLGDAALPVAMRQQAAELLGRIDRPEAQAALLAQLRSAPQPVELAIATAIAGNKQTAETLLAEIRAGHAPAALLKEAAIVDRLRTAGVANVDPQVAELTAKLAPADDRVTKLIASRRQGFLAGSFDPAAGRAVFARSVCANCHRVGDVGKNLGPALDGIGSRGLDRLLEDMLDPNRNVDQAFRTVIVQTDGGQVVSGFGLREEGSTLVLSDSKGEQIRLPLAEVESRTPSSLSPMPGNISEQIPEADFYQLLAFLLSQRPK